VPARRRWAAWLLGPAGAVALTAVLSPLRGSLGLSGVLLCLLLAIAGVARVGGLLPAAGTTAAAALAADFFFITPPHSLVVDRAVDIGPLLVFLAVAGIVSHLIDGLARRSQQAVRAQAEAQVLARLAGATVESGARALPELLAELREVFALDGAGVLVRSGEGWRPVTVSGGPLPHEPADAAFAADLGQGAVLVLAGPGLSQEDARLLGPFVTQLRLARERERLAAAASAAEALAHTDRLHITLLEAVGHDLRTPLAAIAAAAARLEAVGEDTGPSGVRVLGAGIGTEAARMLHLVANLLDLSRLQVGAVPVTPRPTVLRDVVTAALASLPEEQPAVGVRIELPEDLPRVEADPGLLERALANVVANARTWSPPGTAVRVDAGAVAGRVDLRVIDRGPGVAAADPESLFQPFRRTERHPDGTAGGVGLGLTVARGFVEAMDGELTVETTPGGGTTFVFGLRALPPSPRD
jgi:two-component system sensor histidine kinase KdpD